MILTDAQSILYEVLAKVDMIGFGALDQMLGRQPDGTLEKLYPVVDVALIVALAMMLRGLLKLSRRVRRRARPAAQGRVLRLAGIAFHGYLDVIVPVLLLVRMPGAFGASWPVLVRTDVGMVVFVLIVVRLAGGTLRLAGWWRSGRLPAWANVHPEVSRVAVAG